MEQQEYLIKLQMLEQEASQYGEQLEMIDKQVVELNRLKRDIENLSNTKEKEMFSEVGKGIYVKGELNNSQMLVDVGHRVFVPKTSSEIKSIVDSQIKKFADVKEEIAQKIEEINQEVDNLIKEISGSRVKKEPKSLPKNNSKGKK